MNRLVFAVALVLTLCLGTLEAPAAPVVGFDDAATWWRFDDDLTDSNAPPASDGSVVAGTVGYTNAVDAGNQSNGRAAVFNGDRIHVTAGSGNELDTDSYTNGLTVFTRIDPTVRPGIGGQCVVTRDGYSALPRVFSLEVAHTSTQGRVSWRAWTSSSSNGIDYTETGLFSEPGFHDVVGIFRPGQATEVYIDGELWHSRVTSGTTLVPGGNVAVSIGNRGYTNYPYYGDMESSAVWNQALEPVDVKRLTEGLLDQSDAKAWLRFGGDYTDSNTPPASDGTPHGGVSIVSNPPPEPPYGMNNGQVARFDGSNDYIDLGLGGSDELDIDGTNGFTVFARLYPHEESTATFVSRDGFPGYMSGNAHNNYRSFSLATFGTTGPHFRVWNGTSEFMTSAVPSGFYPDWGNNWHDLVGVFRPGEALEIWVDGVLAGTTSLSITSINQPLDDNSNPVAINLGRAYLKNGAGGWYFDGDMESVAFWDYDLTPAEIRGLAVPEPTSVVLLAFGLLGLLAGRRRRRL